MKSESKYSLSRQIVLLKSYISKLNTNQSFLSLISSVTSVVIGLVVGFIVLLIVNPSESLKSFATILLGGFNLGSVGVGQVIYFATPIILTGLSVAIAFKGGQFNIGASGQYIVGAYVGLYISIKWTFIAPEMLWIFSIIGACLAGALWGIVPALLKAYRNVNEIISGIMMNFIAMYFVNMMLIETIYDPIRSQSLAPQTNIPSLFLGKIFAGSSANGGFILACLIAVFLYIVFKRSVVGFKINTLGINENVARFAGINIKKTIIMTMLISGGLAGIGGISTYLAESGKFLQATEIMAVEGLNGIAVALLALNNPIAVIFTGIFVAHLQVGGFYLQHYEFAPQIIDIVIGIIVYCSAFLTVFKNIMIKILTRIRERK